MSELWDCYDKAFQKIEGKILVRGQEDSFSADEYHLVCDVAVGHADGTYLIMQRDYRKEGYPGKWEFTAGGSALQGESPEECAKRELLEETGLKADSMHEVGRTTIDDHHSHYVVYMATVSCEKDAVILQDGETIDYRWVGKIELLKMKEELATWRVFEMLPELEILPKLELSSTDRIEWLFFDVGSTLLNEEKAYLHRLQDVAEAVNEPFEKIYEMAIAFYRENKKGDLEVMQAYGLPKLTWYKEDEVLYPETVLCLEKLSKRYKIGIIANQSFGTADRLEQHGILQYIDLVVASAEEGVSKPDRRIFEIALQRAGCRPENAVMIGDRIDNDIVPAKKMGMKTVWIKQGFGKYWRIGGEEEKQLIEAAKEAIDRNYDSINWWHTVGAAIRTKSGKIFVGVNCDSVSHGSCAEVIAIGSAITAGERDFDTIVAVLGGDNSKILPPCGNCRQMMYSYDKNINVIVDENTKENIMELLKYPCD